MAIASIIIHCFPIHYRVNDESSPSKSTHPQETRSPKVERPEPDAQEDMEGCYEDVSDQVYYKSLMKKQLDDSSTYTLPYHTVHDIKI